MTPYDAWVLRGPDDRAEVGTQDGDTCGRYPEPDEDQPRGYKLKSCNGVMMDWANGVECDTCGEIPQFSS